MQDDALNHNATRQPPRLTASGPEDKIDNILPWDPSSTGCAQQSPLIREQVIHELSVFPLFVTVYEPISQNYNEIVSNQLINPYFLWTDKVPFCGPALDSSVSIEESLFRFKFAGVPGHPRKFRYSSLGGCDLPATSTRQNTAARLSICMPSSTPTSRSVRTVDFFFNLQYCNTL